MTDGPAPGADPGCSPPGAAPAAHGDPREQREKGDEEQDPPGAVTVDQVPDADGQEDRRSDEGESGEEPIGGSSFGTRWARHRRNERFGVG